jgi:hypothetical protein
MVLGRYPYRLSPDDPAQVRQAASKIEALRSDFSMMDAALAAGSKRLV